MTGVRSTTNFLRFLAVLQILTAGILFMPEECLAWWHRWLGLGVMPADAVLRYTIRGGAFVQGAIGVLLWMIASDVVRYRPLVVTVGAIYLASGPAFFFIDTFSGMPQFWCFLDGISCLTVGGIILALSSKIEPSRS